MRNSEGDFNKVQMFFEGNLEGIDRHRDTIRGVPIGPKTPKKAQGHKEEVWRGFEQSVLGRPGTK